MLLRHHLQCLSCIWCLCTRWRGSSGWSTSSRAGAWCWGRRSTRRSWRSVSVGLAQLLRLNVTLHLAAALEIKVLNEIFCEIIPNCIHEVL